MLDADRSVQHSIDRRPHRRRVGSVLRLRDDDGARQQLRQPFHLHRQVPRVPEGRQTAAAQTGRAVNGAAR